MLNDIAVVQSAVSAFNNAALWAPAFLWSAILMLPLFVVVYWCGAQITERLGWTRTNILENVTVWTAGLTMVWVVLFGGNYDVLRDDLSVLPMVTAVIVFLTSLFVSSHLSRGALRKMPRWKWVVLILFMAMLALSDTHIWWGPLLQVGAFLLGGVLGCAAQGKMRPVAGIILIMQMVVVAMLMQPEFFRFGQLGNLTVVHLLTILALGIVSMAVVAIKNIPARGKISDNVYVKLKWLMRVGCALGGALFILTEAVPILLGTLGAVFVAFALSIWHQKSVSDVLADKLLAVALMMFGVITVMPVISALGILYWANVPNVKFWAESKRLL